MVLADLGAVGAGNDYLVTKADVETVITHDDQVKAIDYF
jgi:hypothetical protein